MLQLWSKKFFPKIVSTPGKLEWVLWLSDFIPFVLTSNVKLVASEKFSSYQILLSIHWWWLWIMRVIVRTGNLVQGLLALCCQGKKARRIVDLWRTGDAQCNGEERCCPWMILDFWSFHSYFALSLLLVNGTQGIFWIREKLCFSMLGNKYN